MNLIYAERGKPYDYIFVDIHEAVLIMQNTPMSALVRQLEIVCEKDPFAFQHIAQWLREADHRTAPVPYQDKYDLEEDP